RFPEDATLAQKRAPERLESLYDGRHGVRILFEEEKPEYLAPAQIRWVAGLINGYLRAEIKMDTLNPYRLFESQELAEPFEEGVKSLLEKRLAIMKNALGAAEIMKGSLQKVLEEYSKRAS
ncbi:MAG: hypothetical protein NZM26_04885, partial [Patescibacteria group bacterium]|nr:hypothetical protein [Patescibacteria group bacterium]